MRAAKRSGAVLPPALTKAFLQGPSRSHLEHIIDVPVDTIIPYPDNLIAFSLKKNFTLAIISDLPILRMRRTIDLDDEPCFSAQEIDNIGIDVNLANELEFL